MKDFIHRLNHWQPAFFFALAFHLGLTHLFGFQLKHTDSRVLPELIFLGSILQRQDFSVGKKAAKVKVMPYEQETIALPDGREDRMIDSGTLEKPLSVPAPPTAKVCIKTSFVQTPPQIQEPKVLGIPEAVPYLPLRQRKP